MSSAQKHDANVFLPGCLGPVKRVIVLEDDYDALAAKAERYIQEGISLADQRDALAADNQRMREALGMISIAAKGSSVAALVYIANEALAGSKDVDL